MTNLNIPENIAGVLACPICKSGSLAFEPSKIICAACSRSFMPQNGIPDMAHTGNVRLPAIYNDPAYLRWGEHWAASHDYFYQTGGILSWVQNSGHHAVRSLMGQRDYRLILDLGCGDGAHYPFQRQPQRCLGMDLDMKSLVKLKGKHPGFFVIRANGYNLPVRDAGVDCIINLYNLEHMAYLDLALEEMARILAPGGDVFISVPNEGGLFWVAGRNMTSVKKFAAMNYRRIVEIEHINCIWQLDKAFRRYFDIKKRVSFPFFLPSFHLNLVTTYHCVKRAEG